MCPWTKLDPPTWFPSAVLSQAGWRNPVTGELLVAIRGLQDKRRDELDQDESQILLESSGFFILEQDLGSDLGPDFLILES